jgi:hypothetical protein
VGIVVDVAAAALAVAVAGTTTALALHLDRLLIRRLASNMHDFGSMNLKQLIQPIVHHHIGFFVEAPERASFPRNVNAYTSIDGKREQNHEPNWPVEDGDTEYIPVHGNPAP